jgi:hypothetical protein
MIILIPRHTYLIHMNMHREFGIVPFNVFQWQNMTYLAQSCPSSVSPSVRLSVRTSVRPSVNFYTFDFFFRTTGQILTRVGTDQHWGEGLQVCSNEVGCPSLRGDNIESVKIHWTFFKKNLLQNQQAKFNQT